MKGKRDTVLQTIKDERYPRLQFRLPQERIDWFRNYAERQGKPRKHWLSLKPSILDAYGLLVSVRNRVGGEKRCLS